MRISLPFLLRRAALGLAAAATIVFTATRVTPVFLDESLRPRLMIPLATGDEKAMLLAPWSRLSFDDALATSTFLRDRSAFAIDLVGTGKVGLARALALADVAVREAYRRQVPPALVLGVLLTENDELKSTARSRDLGYTSGRSLPAVQRDLRTTAFQCAIGSNGSTTARRSPQLQTLGATSAVRKRISLRSAISGMRRSY